MKASIERDERSVAVENASYRIGYMILAVGVLLAVMYRSWAYNQSSWDLMALVILSSFAATVYQARHSIYSRRSAWAFLWIGVGSAVAAALVVLLLRFVY
jgi:hypothetical protein